eukprot:4043837-Amphidinium_carterae.1
MPGKTANTIPTPHHHIFIMHIVLLLTLLHPSSVGLGCNHGQYLFVKQNISIGTTSDTNTKVAHSSL